MTLIQAQISEIKDFILQNDVSLKVSVMANIHLNTVRDFILHDRNLRTRNLVAIEEAVEKVKSDKFFRDRRDWRPKKKPPKGLSISK